jgi:hypothetical protein
MAGAFNFNRAPFFQSFVEVRVDGERARVILIPHGVNGPLKWSDLDTFGAIIPSGKNGENTVEVVVPMR